MTDTTVTEIVLTDTAAALIKTDVGAFKRDSSRYSDYVCEMEVDADNLPDHVALFRTAYKMTYPKASGEEVKAYATKVRNGLKRWAGREVDAPETATPDYLALAVQAARTAHDKGEVDYRSIVDAILSAVDAPALA